MADDHTQSLIDDPAIQAVEIKLTVRADQEHMVRSALERVDVEPEHRKVYFFDTPDLTLYDSGMVLRARVRRDDADDSTVKLRPVVPSEVDAEWKKLDDFAIELDAVGTNLVCSAKLGAEQANGEIDAVVAGERNADKLLSKEQERLVAAHAPAGIDWSTIKPLGPIEVKKWEVKPKGFAHEITVEEWVLPDDSDLLELSIGVAPEGARQANDDLRAFLTERGLDVDGDQATKTKTALFFFTGRAE